MHRQVGVDPQKREDALIHPLCVCYEVFEYYDVHALRFKNVEIATQLLGELDGMAVEVRLHPEGSRWNSAPFPAIRLRSERVLEGQEIFSLVKEQLAVLGVHDVNRIAQHHDDSRFGKEITNLAGR